MLMFLYLILMWVGIYFIFQPQRVNLYYGLTKCNYDTTLLQLNGDSKKALKGGCLWLLLSLIPIIDFLIVEFSEDYFPPYNWGITAWRDYKSDYILGDSPIFGCDYVDIIPFLAVLSSLILFIVYSISIYVNSNRILSGNKAFIDKRNKELDIYNEKLNSFQKKFGEVKKIINLKRVYSDIYDPLDINNQILIFFDSKHIIINNKELAFDQLINWHYTDNPIYETTEKSTTKHNTGSIIGRAAVGGLVVGPVGAIIGGTTGKKHTNTESHTQIKHNYDVIITISDISSPTITLNLEDNDALVNDIIGTLNVIKEKL